MCKFGPLSYLTQEYLSVQEQVWHLGLALGENGGNQWLRSQGTILYLLCIIIQYKCQDLAYHLYL